MAEETGNKIIDIVTAELVECAPAPEPVATTPLPTSPDASPVEHAAEATIEQTGAGPPPDGE